MHIFRHRQLEEMRQVSLPWCGAEQIITPNHLIHPLVGVVYDDGQVICPVWLRPAPAQHHVIDFSHHLPGVIVVDLPLGDFSPEPQGRHPALPNQFGPFEHAFVFREVPAGTRIVARYTVRRLGCFGYFSPRAVAFIVRQFHQSRSIILKSLRLVQHLPIPIQA